MLYKIEGIVMLITMAVIFAMMVWSYLEEAKREARKEERRDARAYGLEIARKEYDRLINSTQFRVTQSVVISNESDIQW